ncbi:hypothetical protein B0H14DRAFT_2600606 [Mycena olivaceomarginata]|nr:hypothetical protein B0H14DRAFT_2600606 [Mycena olivaceomarginata]
MTTLSPAIPAPSATAEPAANPLAGLSDLFTVDSADLRAQISAHTPILFTPAGEPYLALPAPFERFYLSPERVSDVPADIAMMFFLVAILTDHRATSGLRARSSGRPFPSHPSPRSAGSYASAASFRRSSPHTQRASSAALHPEWHRKGLATAAVRIVMHDWAIPQMGCTELCAECLASNIGSVRVWQKYGFVEDPELRTEVKITEAKGGGVEQGCVLIWSLK